MAGEHGNHLIGETRLDGACLANEQAQLQWAREQQCVSGVCWCFLRLRYRRGSDKMSIVLLIPKCLGSRGKRMSIILHSVTSDVIAEIGNVDLFVPLSTDSVQRTKDAFSKYGGS